jgi:hypothetical protein
MSIFKRARLYITRKRGRSILLFAIMLLTSVFAMLGLAVKQSADKEAAAIRKSLAGSFKIEMNLNAFKALMGEYGGSAPPPEQRPVMPDLDMYERITKLDHITHFYTGGKVVGTYVDLKLRPGWLSSLLELGNTDILRHYNYTPEQAAVSKQVLSLQTCSDTGLHEFFRMGAFELIEGRHITAGDTFKALISADLAGRNGLTVGDTFSCELREYAIIAGGDPNKRWGDPFTLEIAGIYDIKFATEPTGYYTEYTGDEVISGNEFMYPENIIFCDLYTAAYRNAVMVAYYRVYLGEDDTLDTAAMENPTVEDNVDLTDVTFFVDDPENLDAVISELKSQGELDWRYFTVKPDDCAYRASVKPLTRLGATAAILIVSAVIGCVVILGLTLNMWIKSRRREIGVLMSLGVSRRTILMQLLLEALAIAVLALIAASALSYCLADGAGSMAEASVSPKNTEETFDYYYQLELVLPPCIITTSADPSDLTYGLGAANILIVAAMVLFCAVLSVLVTSWSVLKLKPNHLLTRR